MLPNRYGIAIIQCQCGTVTTQKIVIGRRCGGAHAGAFPCSKLNRKMADTARTRQHQNPLTGLQATHIEQRLPGSEARKRQTTGVGQGNGLRRPRQVPASATTYSAQAPAGNGKFTMP